MEIGTDWKSLVRSGLLPITTDFFPDGLSLMEEYSFSSYLVDIGYPQSSKIVIGVKSGDDYRHTLFDELVCQRLQKGFQVCL